MKMQIAKIFLLIVTIFLFSACKNAENEIIEPGEIASLPEPTSQPATPQPPSWRDAFAEILFEHKQMGDGLRFFLYDFDRNEIPELLIVGEYEDEVYDAVYTFHDGAAFSLEYDEEVRISDYALYARGGIIAPMDETEGMIPSLVGIGTLFGASWYCWQVVMDGDRLVIQNSGGIIIDYDTLHELFDDFGRDADTETLHAAIEEHTHFYVNDEIVSEEEFFRVFNIAHGVNGIWHRLPLPLLITDENINDVIYSLRGT